MRTQTRNHARLLGLALVVGLGMLVTACAPTRVVVREPQPKVVVVAKGHVHSDHCGHYRKGNTWYLVKGHKHGKRCGHAKVRGVWVIR